MRPSFGSYRCKTSKETQASQKTVAQETQETIEIITPHLTHLNKNEPKHTRTLQPEVHQLSLKDFSQMSIELLIETS
jgi:hypothetical protein